MNTPKLPENPFVFPFTPTDKSGQIGPTECGIQLRDYFAAKAMQGIVGAACFSQAAEDMMKKAGIDVKKDTDAFVAMLAYGIADAMLAERSKNDGR